MQVGLALSDFDGLNLATSAPLMLARHGYAVPSRQGAPALELLHGVRSFSTAAAPWSATRVMACTCHPDGLTDGVTWVFSTGPRQTIALNGTFNKADPSDHRVQNWTGVADEIDDVEGLVRSTMKGQGAIERFDADAGTFVPLSLTQGLSLDAGPDTRNDALNGSSRWVSDRLSTVQDWVGIERYLQQLRSNQAPRGLDQAAVARGRAIFESAGCVSCHAGPKWTVSHVPYVPSPEKNGSAVGDNGLPAAPTGLRTQLLGAVLPGLNFDTLKIAPERIAQVDGGTRVVGPERVTCVIRSVGTFDGGNPLEVRADGTTAQGELGFNVPSLLGVGGTAPYFHHGAASSLEAVFTEPFAPHFRAGNPAFLPTAGATLAEQAQIADLVVFLRSIDDHTSPFSATSNIDLCGNY